jgi:hypothetical protein
MKGYCLRWPHPPRKGSLSGVPADEAFNLPAAELRAGQDQLAMSVEVLATTLEQALPQLVSVERRRARGFRSKRSEVQRILVTLAGEQFELCPTAQGVHCTRHKVVGGITLSRQELAMADWIAEVIAGVTRSAEVGERDRIALEGLLR